MQNRALLNAIGAQETLEHANRKLYINEGHKITAADHRASHTAARARNAAVKRLGKDEYTLFERFRGMSDDARERLKAELVAAIENRGKK